MEYLTGTSYMIAEFFKGPAKAFGEWLREYIRGKTGKDYVSLPNSIITLVAGIACLIFLAAIRNIAALEAVFPGSYVVKDLSFFGPYENLTLPIKIINDITLSIMVMGGSRLVNRIVSLVESVLLKIKEVTGGGG